MPGDDGRNRTTGPMPTLCIGIGAWAQETLAELVRLARGVTIPLAGPFGLVLADSRAEGLYACDWRRAAEMRFPEPAFVRERAEFVGPEEEKLTQLLSAVVRRLCAVGPDAETPTGGRLRLNCYVVLDLSEATASVSAVRLMRVLRQVDGAVDTTVLCLTARTAGHGAPGDQQWFETWKTLLGSLQEGPLAQRVYLLDGCDTDKSWLEQPEQLQRLGAEFLFYHGLACRPLLRQEERARTGAAESLLNVCGSFGCRTIPADLAVVAERVAERVAREDLTDLYRRTVPSGWLASLQEQARALVERLAVICERPPDTKTGGGVRGGHAEMLPSQDAQTAEMLSRTIRQVCTREPLVSLCLFFQLLRPKLARLLSQQRLWDRARVRHLVAQTFRQQAESTYKPLQTWLAQPQLRWEDRFTPVPEAPPEVAVSRPASFSKYRAGGILLAVGMALVATGMAWSRFLAVAGGLIGIAATLLMSWPMGWVLHPRQRVREGQEPRAAAGEVLYRRQASRRTRRIWGALILAGVAAATWSMWARVLTWGGAARAVAFVALVGAGLALLLQGPKQSRPDQVSDEEAPDHAPPSQPKYRAAGLLSLALAWVLFGLGMPAAGVFKSPALGVAGLAGLLLVATGLGVVLYPRTGYAYLIDCLTKMPQPLPGGIGRPFRERELPWAVTTLDAWLNRLAVEPDQCLERLQAAEPRPSREGAAPGMRRTGEPGTLLDFVAADWEGQLAQAFRRAIADKSAKSVKALAAQPVLWAECIVRQLQEPYDCSRTAHAGSSCELTSLFALQAVRAWVESLSLAELLSYLNLDFTRFSTCLGRLACVHWPTPRVDPDRNTCIVAVTQPLWEALTPLARPAGAPTLVLLDWGSAEDKIVVLRTVQGLTQGWRGFPGLPGQWHGEPPKPDSSSLRPLIPAPSRPAPAHA